MQENVVFTHQLRTERQVNNAPIATGTKCRFVPEPLKGGWGNQVSGKTVTTIYYEDGSSESGDITESDKKLFFAKL